MKELRNIIADNLIRLRKAHNFTQVALAEMLNYSDKAVSKWERADTMPDIETLKAIADLYNITVDYLLVEHAEEEKIDTKQYKKNLSNKIIITCLAVTLVWFVAIFIYAECQFISYYNYWQAFIWALPATFLIILIFNSIWGKRKYIYFIITLFMWTLILAIHLQFIEYKMWLIYLLGVPGQIAIVLASQLKRN